MTDQSTNLRLPYLMPSQAQKHVTVNETVRRLDALVQTAVESRSVSAQPGAPDDGAVWIVPPGKTGAEWGLFANHALAYHRDGAWEEIQPKEGWKAYVRDEGATFVFDGANWVGDAAAAPSSTRRNALINGAFNVWQRGSSFSSGPYSADRWVLSFGAGGAGTLTRETFAPGGPLGAGHGEPQYFMRHTQSSAGGGNAMLYQCMEDARIFAGETVTWSFWARVASGTLSLTPYFDQVFGAGGSSAVGTPGSAVTLTTSWQRFEVTFAAPSIAGKTFGPDSFARVYLWHPGSATFAADFAFVQVEAGGVASKFEHIDPALEMTLCQRYYESSYNPGVAPGGVSDPGAIQMAQAGASLLWPVSFATRKRATPTVTIYSPVSGLSGKVRNISAAGDESVVATGMGDTGFAAFINATATDGHLYYWHWVAEAEY